MINLPDLTPIFYFAIFGMICAAIVTVVGGGWLAYHLVRAVLLYVGWSA